MYQYIYSLENFDLYHVRTSESKPTSSHFVVNMSVVTIATQVITLCLRLIFMLNFLSVSKILDMSTGKESNWVTYTFRFFKHTYPLTDGFVRISITTMFAPKVSPYIGNRFNLYKSVKTLSSLLGRYHRTSVTEWNERLIHYFNVNDA